MKISKIKMNFVKGELNLKEVGLLVYYSINRQPNSIKGPKYKIDYQENFKSFIIVLVFHFEYT